MTRWLSDDEQRAWRGLLALSSQLRARLGHELQEQSRLSLADYDVLVALTDAPDGRRRVFELVQSLGWEQSRLSHHLARMARRGLVAREACPEDRRGAFAVLTTAGREAIEAAAPAHVELVRRLVFEVLSPDQVATLESISALVLARLADDLASSSP